MASARCDACGHTYDDKRALSKNAEGSLVCIACGSDDIAIVVSTAAPEPLSAPRKGATGSSPANPTATSSGGWYGD